MMTTTIDTIATTTEISSTPVIVESHTLETTGDMVSQILDEVVDSAVKKTAETVGVTEKTEMTDDEVISAFSQIQSNNHGKKDVVYNETELSIISRYKELQSAKDKLRIAAKSKEKKAKTGDVKKKAKKATEKKAKKATEKTTDPICVVPQTLTPEEEKILDAANAIKLKHHYEALSKILGVEIDDIHSRLTEFRDELKPTYDSLEEINVKHREEIKEMKLRHSSETKDLSEKLRDGKDRMNKYQMQFRSKCTHCFDGAKCTVCGANA